MRGGPLGQGEVRGGAGKGRGRARSLRRLQAGGGGTLTKGFTFSYSNPRQPPPPRFRFRCACISGSPREERGAAGRIEREPCCSRRLSPRRGVPGGGALVKEIRVEPFSARPQKTPSASGRGAKKAARFHGPSRLLLAKWSPPVSAASCRSRAAYSRRHI